VLGQISSGAVPVKRINFGGLRGFNPIFSRERCGYTPRLKTNFVARWDGICARFPVGFSLALSFAALDVWPSGCQKSYISLSPAAVVVPADQVWSAAQYYAKLRPNAIVVAGEGDGMTPLYSAGTVLVVEGVEYSTLKEGMTVMFRDERGIRVTHLLLKRTPDGWSTLGLNQGFEPDAHPMTRSNFLGVVIMAFTPAKPAVGPVPKPSG
jgi:hypothetical protein